MLELANFGTKKFDRGNLTFWGLFGFFDCFVMVKSW
jgi:hypothetical protein